MGFCQSPEMGPKLGNKWDLRCKCGSKCVKTHLVLTFNPFRSIDKKPSFYPLQGGWKLFSKKDPEAVLTQHKSSLSGPMLRDIATQYPISRDTLLGRITSAKIVVLDFLETIIVCWELLNGVGVD